MKWIGAHIWDFISRFRSDVYLEATETGTIASGGNLGLDSNNKIVKANTESGELTIANALNNRIVTSNGGTGLNAEEFATFSSSVSSSVLSIVSPEAAADYFSIITSTNGATSITTVKDGVDSSANVLILADGTAELAGTTVILDSAGDIELESVNVNTTGIFRGSNIGSIQDGKIPISPTLFIASSYRFHPQYSLVGGGITMASASVNAYCEVVVPNGYTATSCTMYATDVDNDGTIRCSVTHDFGANDVIGNGAKTVVIEWNPGDTVDVLHGGFISIAKTV